jgi:hypothetical protein
MWLFAQFHLENDMRGSTKDTVSWTAAMGAAKYKVYATAKNSTARTERGSANSHGQTQDNTDCSCLWQSMTCASDVAAGSTCKYCETANTCADFDHAPADTGENYQTCSMDTSGNCSALSSNATDNTGTPTPATPAPSTTPAPGMSISCVGVTHYVGHSVITVCVTLTNVPSSNLNDVHTSMGSTYAYDSTFNLDGSSYLTKSCGKFDIANYGYYSGMAGVTTTGGSAALIWDINVTSTAVPCS